MASVNLTGTLLNPEGEPDVGAIVKFTLLTTTGSTISSAYSELLVPPDGTYNIDVVYGQLRVDYVSENAERFVAIVVVNSNTVATSLPELLNATTPPTNAQLIQFQAILADCVTAKNAAEAAAATIVPTTGPTDATAGRILRAQDAYAVNSTNFHAGNTNFNVFGGASNTIIAKGVALSATQALFYLPLNSKVDPSGITFIPAANFYMTRGTTGAGTVTTLGGQTSSSSKKLASFTADVSGGLSLGEPLNLRLHTTQAAAITVNY